MAINLTIPAPAWAIVSAYVGKRAKYKGLQFSTEHEFYNLDIAQDTASYLNSLRQDTWAGRDFEFQVVPTDA